MDLPSKEITLNYSLLHVKSAIKLLANYKGGTIQVKDQNDILNTYRFAIVSGLRANFINITLNQLDESTTKATFMMTPTFGVKEPNTGDMVQMMDNFLQIFASVLETGEVKQEVVSKNSGGCFGLILIIVTAITLLITQ